MKKVLSLVLTLVLVTTSFTLAQEKADPEKEAWNKVDEMDVTQLREFVKKFPHGKYAKDAQFDLSLHQKIADIKAGKVKNPVVIPFEKLGKRWEYWCKANPERGAVGVYRNESTAGIFRAMGCATISTDYSGMVMAPTGDGAIVAIKTAGLKYQ